MHLSDEFLERALHNELHGVEGAAARAHLAECGACQLEVAERQAAELQMFSTFGALDVPTRLPAIDEVLRTSHARARVVPFGVRLAASILGMVVLGGVTLYAMPNSPLRRWLRPARPATAPAPQPPPAPDAPASGVTVLPGGHLTIAFMFAQSAGELRVRLTDDNGASVRALGARVPFAVGEGRLTVSNAGASASYDIAIPRAAPLVEIMIAGRRVWQTAAGRLTSAWPMRDGIITIPLR